MQMKSSWSISERELHFDGHLNANDNITVGDFIIASEPTSSNQVATKNYVDNNIVVP